MKKNIPYIRLKGVSAPRSDKNIIKFDCVTAIIKNKDTGLFLALEFIQWEYGLVWWKVEDWENKEKAMIREIEEETGYKKAKILWVVFKEIYGRWYKPRKNREEEGLDRVYITEIEEKNKSEILGADVWTEGVFWFTEIEMLKKLTLTHHIHYFKEYLKNK